MNINDSSYVVQSEQYIESSTEVTHVLNEFQKACTAKDYKSIKDIFEKHSSKISRKEINSIFCNAVIQKDVEFVNFFLENSIGDVSATQDETPIIHIACRLGSLEITQLLIKHGADINTVCLNKESPLSFAIQSCENELIKWLLENGARTDLNSLYQAFLYQSPQAVRLLLQHGASLDVPINEEGQSLLHLVCGYHLLQIDKDNEEEKILSLPATICSKSRIELLEILKEANQFDYMTEDPGGFSPIDFAIMSGYPDVLEYLLENGLKVQSLKPREKIKLWQCAFDGSKEAYTAVDVLCKSGLDFFDLPEEFYFRIWHLLITSIHIQPQDIEKLLELGLLVQSKESKDTPLHIACRKNKKDIIRILLQRGALKNVPNLDGDTPFDLALKRVQSGDIIDEFLRDPEIQKTFVIRKEHFSPIYENLKKLIESPLFFNCPMEFVIYSLKLKSKCLNELLPVFCNTYPDFAKHEKFTEFYMKLVKEGNFEAIKNLYAQDIPIPQGDSRANTPLHYACGSGNIELIEWFLDREISSNARNVFDETPLHIAIKKGCQNEDILDLFIKWGFDLYAQDQWGFTIFSKVVDDEKRVDLKFLKKLLEIDEQKRFLSIPSKRGNFPVHFLAYHGHCKALEYLLDTFEVDIEKQNNDGQTPLHSVMCDPEGKEDLYIKTIKTLLDHGCNVNAKDNVSKNVLHHLFSGKTSREKIRALFLPVHAHLLMEKDCKGITPLHIACKNHSVDAVKELFGFAGLEQQGSVSDFIHEVDDNGKTYLHFAAQNKDKRVLQFLIQKGFDIHAQTQNGVQPIHIALRKKKKDNVTFLLDLGASPLAQMSNGTTCLDLALTTKKNEVALELIGKGAVLFSGKKSRSLPSKFWKKQIPQIIQDAFLRKAFDRFFSFFEGQDFSTFIDEIQKQPEFLLEKIKPTEKLLEFLYLAQNQALVMKIIPQISEDVFKDGIDKFSLDVPTELLYEFFIFDEIDPFHFAKEVAPKSLPQWNDASIQITDLETIISELEFTDPVSEYYIDPRLLVSNGKSYNEKDLKAYFKTYITRIVNEIEFTGTPPKGTERINEFYNTLKNAVLPLIAKMKTLTKTEEDKELKVKILLELLPGISHCGPRWQLDALRAYVKFYLGKKDNFEFRILQLLQEQRGLIIDAMVDPSNTNNIHEAIGITKVFGEKLGLVHVEFEDEFAKDKIKKKQLLHKFFKAYTVEDIVDLIWIEVKNTKALYDLLIETLYTMDFPIPEGVDDEIEYLMNLWTQETSDPVSEIIASKKRIVKREVIVQVLNYLKIIRQIKPKD